MYVGVRAGGGIGDEIEDPAGDEFEVERIVFDITFFFFVIVILLAIIQGESLYHESEDIQNLYLTCLYQDTNTFLLPWWTRIHLMNFYVRNRKKSTGSVYSNENDTHNPSRTDTQTRTILVFLQA